MTDATCRRSDATQCRQAQVSCRSPHNYVGRRSVTLSDVACARWTPHNPDMCTTHCQELRHRSGRSISSQVEVAYRRRMYRTSWKERTAAACTAHCQGLHHRSGRGKTPTVEVAYRRRMHHTYRNAAYCWRRKHTAGGGIVLPVEVAYCRWWQHTAGGGSILPRRR